MSATGLPSGRRFLKIHILVPVLMNLKVNVGKISSSSSNQQNTDKTYSAGTLSIVRSALNYLSIIRPRTQSKNPFQFGKPFYLPVNSTCQHSVNNKKITLALYADETGNLTSSSPIDRTTFVTHFFRRSIGFKTPARSTRNELQPRPESNLYPRVCGQTDSATRSLYDLSESAYTNLCSIESFINHTHHPYHPHQSLGSGLAVLVDWIRAEIMDCFEHESALDSGLLTASLMIEPLFELLEALATLIQSCQEGTKKSSQEDAVYRHLDIHIRQRSSSLIQAVFSWLLDRVCAALLLSWQTWLGVDLGGRRTIWPDEKDQLYQSLWSQYGIQPDPRLSVDPHLDLAGDYLDQTEARTPSSYCFRPDRVPSFIPISLAESIFKAGVSLRILRHSNPFHPICLTYPAEEHGQSRVFKAFNRQRHDMKLQISAWRHGIKLSDDPLATIQRSKGVSLPTMQDIEQELDIGDFLKAISTGLKPYDNQVGGSRHIDQRRKGLIETVEERLRSCRVPGD
ncbi:hypothetical protein PtB15_16B304 [Puccinia triticina]|nr:hypothetical protein PtB15_16B304 [Puccinia triticina]